MNGLWWLAAAVGLGVFVAVLDRWERRMSREARRLDEERSARRLRDEIERH